MRSDEIVAREFCRAWCGVAPRTPEQIAVIVDNTWTDFIPEAQSALLALEEAGFVVMKPHFDADRAIGIEAAAREMLKAMKDTDHRVGPVVGSAVAKLRDAIRYRSASQSPPAKETA